VHGSAETASRSPFLARRENLADPWQPRLAPPAASTSIHGCPRAPLPLSLRDARISPIHGSRALLPQQRRASIHGCPRAPLPLSLRDTRISPIHGSRASLPQPRRLPSMAARGPRSPFPCATRDRRDCPQIAPIHGSYTPLPQPCPAPLAAPGNSAFHPWQLSSPKSAVNRRSAQAPTRSLKSAANRPQSFHPWLPRPAPPSWQPRSLHALPSMAAFPPFLLLTNRPPGLAVAFPHCSPSSLPPFAHHICPFLSPSQ
jgi:hypothetical protein